MPQRVYADDIPLGFTEELGEYRITEEEIVAFASQWDPQYIHVDADRAAKEGPLGLIASGLQTMCVYQRLSVLAREGEIQVIGGTGISDLKLRRPVRPGDVLRGRSVVEAVRHEPARQRALITQRGTLVNQEGELVMSVLSNAYVQARSPEED